MTYAARDDTTLPKLLAQMRWVVLVDKRLNRPGESGDSLI